MVRSRVNNDDPKLDLRVPEGFHKSSLDERRTSIRQDNVAARNLLPNFQANSDRSRFDLLACVSVDFINQSLLLLKGKNWGELYADPSNRVTYIFIALGGFLERNQNLDVLQSVCHRDGEWSTALQEFYCWLNFSLESAAEDLFGRSHIVSNELG